MKKIRIIIMGKTGVGKSTLINAVLSEDKAETGTGIPITAENKIYMCEKLLNIEKTANTYAMTKYEISLYDTVGLELNSQTTENTLTEIQKYILEGQKDNTDDVNIIWFCINERTHRFEEYEIKLIKKISLKYEIPFAIVLTQCMSQKESSLEKDIKNAMPDVPVKRILAKDYELDNMTIKSFGTEELLIASIRDYHSYKYKIIEDEIDQIVETYENRMKETQEKGNYAVRKYVDKARKAGRIPIGCIPLVHSLCAQMISEINRVCKISKDDGFAEEIFADVVLGVIVTPFMAVPFLSIAVAETYIETVGEGYLKAVIEIIKTSSESELENKEYVKRKLKEKLKG